MTRLASPIAVALAASVALLTPDVQSQGKPLPEGDAFYEEVRANLARSDREQYRYAYRERRSELHTNPFGRIGTGGLLIFDVVPGPELGIYHRRLVERDGKPVTNQKLEVIDRRARGTGNRSIDDVVATLEFSVRGRETHGGRDTIVVDFAPKKDAKPKTRQGKIAKVFKGSVWIDEASREVMRVDAISTDSMSYGGFIARLGEGTRAQLERERVGAVWLPTSIRLTGDGRALLFRKLNVDYVIEWVDYRRVLDD